MFLDKPIEKENKEKKQRKITLRIPKKLWRLIQEKAKNEYTGQGKISKLVNEALKHFLISSCVDEIKWDNLSDDYVLINLLTQIKMGSMIKDNGPHPVQVNIDIDLYEKLIDLEINIRSTRKMINVFIKPAVIRMSLSQWMYADRKFLDKNL